MHDARHVAASDAEVERRSRHHRDDARHLPSAQGRLQKTVVRVLEERQLVDEVDECNLGAVIRRWADVIAPSRIRVSGVVEIAAAAIAAGVRINRVPDRISNLQGEIVAYVAMQVDLERVVMAILTVLGHADRAVALIVVELVDAGAARSD